MATGPPVNYTRITAAIAEHKGLMARVESIMAMQDLVSGGAKSFLTVDGGGQPLALPKPKVEQLLALGLAAAEESVTALGTALAAATQGLPA